MAGNGTAQNASEDILEQKQQVRLAELLYRVSSRSVVVLEARA